jgi:DNA-binding response OmpR family regulator
MAVKTDGKRVLPDYLALLRKSPDAVPLDASEACRAAEKAGKPAKMLLVVDDDAAVRELEAEILHREGYKVLQARSAEEGLALARQVDAIHLLVTDFSMPEVDGLELSHRFRSLYPKTPVLMISGSLPLLRDGTRDLEHVALLAKPFALNELLDKVRALLGAAPLVQLRKPLRHD